MQASTFGLARELVLAGADPVRIAQERVFFNHLASRLLLLGTALGNSEARRPAGLAVGTASRYVRTCAADEGL